MAMEYREEKDTMGVIRVPKSAYYGAQTQRAVENFSISGLRFPPALIQAVVRIKKYAALVNRDLKKLEDGIAKTIVTVADDILNGKLNDQIVVDVFQTGSGTSLNMNVNEVIAGRCNELLAGTRGGKEPVHPNDHVNLGQSSNDVIPSAIHIAALFEITYHLLPSMKLLHHALVDQATTFQSINKIGRTHLQDAVPVRLGEEFSGYARQVEQCTNRFQAASKGLSELALGGTAVGTGLNTHPDFARKVIAGISEETGLSLAEAGNHFEAQASQDAAVNVSGALKTFSVSLIKIANDIRWLASGPRCGIGEIILPSLQPGSSIMPGKVNPVIPEVVLQAAAQCIGNDTAITLAGQSGNFELNVMLPLIAYNLLQSIDLLDKAVLVLGEKCVQGIVANKEKCTSNLEQSLALVTVLVPEIGYDLAADIAKEAYSTGKTIRQVALGKLSLPADKINQLLDAIVHPAR